MAAKQILSSFYVSTSTVNYLESRDSKMEASFIVLMLLCYCKMARWEHNTRTLSRIFRSSKLACAVLAITIILLGIYRDWR